MIVHLIIKGLCKENTHEIHGHLKTQNGPLRLYSYIIVHIIRILLK